MKMLILLTAAMAAAAAAAAHAQSATPVPSAPVAMPRHSCVKPEFPEIMGVGLRMRELRMSNWQREATAYLDCLKKFATEQRDSAEQLIKLSNATVDEYNASVKEFQQAAGVEPKK